MSDVLALWEDEAKHGADKRIRAVILFELGAHHEFQRFDEESAVREYRACLKIDPGFGPALFALERLGKSVSEGGGMLDLFQHMGRHAGTERGAAQAWVDAAVAAQADGADARRVQRLMEKAVELSPELLDASLMLERHLRCHGAERDASSVVESRVPYVQDPNLRRLLTLEVAQDYAEAGKLDEAVVRLKEASSGPVERWRFLRELSRLLYEMNRSRELTETLGQLADYAFTVADGHNASPGLFHPFSDRAKAKISGSAYLYQQARVMRATNLRQALELVERATAACPRETVLVFEHSELLERLGEKERAIEATQKLVRHTEDPRVKGGLLLRAATLSANGESQRRQVRLLEEAADAYPQSPTILASWRELLSRGNDPLALAQWLETRASRLEGERAATLLWEAAHLVTQRCQDPNRACDLYEKALDRQTKSLRDESDGHPTAAAHPNHVRLLREHYGSMLFLGGEGLSAACEALALHTDDREERDALLFHAYLDAVTDGDHDRSTRLMTEALASGGEGWARMMAIMGTRREGAGLEAAIAAHRSIAGSTEWAEEAAAHRCAAARLLARDDRAEAALEELDAIGASQKSRYAWSLREEILRTQGAHEEVCELLVGQARRDTNVGRAETVLLRAALLAEQSGHAELAMDVYRKVTDVNPSAWGAMWLHYELANRRAEGQAIRQTLRSLRRATGEMGPKGELLLYEFRLLHGIGGEAGDLPDDGTLDLALSRPATAASGCVAALCTPRSPEMWARAARTLDEQHVSKVGQSLGALLSLGSETGAAAPEAALPGTDLMDAHRRLRGNLRIGEQRTAAVRALCRSVEDVGMGSDLQTLGVCSRLVSSLAVQGTQVDGDFSVSEVELAQAEGDRWLLDQLGIYDLATVDPRSGDLPGDTTHPSAQALPFSSVASEAEEFDPSATEANVSGSSMSSAALAAARGRALVLLGRHAEALIVLRNHLEWCPEDQSAWEARVVAAAFAGERDEYVECLDRVASVARGSVRAELLEDAALALLKGEPVRPEDAEVRLRSSLEADPTRFRAYEALHTLLNNRGESSALIELVSKRAKLEKNEASKVNLLHEEAYRRLLAGDSTGASRTASTLRVLDPNHLGGLAICAETFVATGRWAEAVDAIRSMPVDDLSSEDRCLLKETAAWLLHCKLSDDHGALAELLSLQDMGVAPGAWLDKAALLAERLGRYDQAATLLERAAATHAGQENAFLEMEMARICEEHLHDGARARQALERAHAQCPGDMRVGHALAGVLDETGRRRLSQATQGRIYAELDAFVEPLLSGDFAAQDTAHALDEIVSSLALTASWSGDHDLSALCAAVCFFDPLPMVNPDPVFNHSMVDPIKPAPDSHRLFQILLATGAELEPLFGRTRGGLLRRDRVKEAWESTFEGLTATFGFESDRVYVEEALPQPVVLGRRSGDRMQWGLERSVESSEVDVATYGLAVMQGAAFPFGLEAFIDGSLDALCDHLGAICEAAGCEHALPRAGDVDVTSVSKHLSKGTLKVVRSLLHSPLRIEYVRAPFREVQLFARRMVARLTGNLSVALGGVTDAAVHLGVKKDFVSRQHRLHRRDAGIAVTQAPVRTWSVPGTKPSFDHGRWETDVTGLGLRMRSVSVAEKERTGSQQAIRLGIAVDPEQRLTRLSSMAEHTRDPDTRAQLLLSCAEIRWSLGDEEEAFELAASSIRERPGRLETVRWLRRMHMQKKQWPDTVEYLRDEVRLLQHPEERARLLLFASIIALEPLGRLDLACELAEEVLHNEPNRAAWAYWFGLLLHQAKDPRAAEYLESAARDVDDDHFSALVYLDVAQSLELSADVIRARFLYQRCTEQLQRVAGHGAEGLEALHLAAALGGARTALEQRAYPEAAEALSPLVSTLGQEPLGEAFLRMAARILHLSAGRPMQALSVMVAPTSALGALCLADAARDAGDAQVEISACLTWADLSRRTERALALVRAARVREAQGDMEGCKRDLREASHADQTLIFVRVMDEALARRAGDYRQVTRGLLSMGLSGMAAAAVASVTPELGRMERQLFSEAAAAEGSDEKDRVAMTLQLEVAAESNELQTISAAIQSEKNPPPARLAALAGLQLIRGAVGDAARQLSALQQKDPGHPLAGRLLARLTQDRVPQRAAGLWLDEAKHGPAETGAFAFVMAGRLLERTQEGGEQAFLQACQADPQYLPAIWSLEELYRTKGDHGRLRTTILQGLGSSDAGDGGAVGMHRADLGQSATPLLRAAFAGEEFDNELLVRAYRADPTDLALLILLLGRLDGTAALASVCASALPHCMEPFDRVVLLRTLEARGERAHLDAVHGSLGRIQPQDRFIWTILEATELSHVSVEAARSTVDNAETDAGRASALEQLAARLESQGRVKEATEAYRELVNLFPGHVPSLRRLERLHMAAQDPEGVDTLAWVESRLSAVTHSRDARGHLRFAMGLMDREGAGDLLVERYGHVEADGWLARSLESVARRRSDHRLAIQALQELSEYVDDPMSRAAIELRAAELLVSERGASAAAIRLGRLDFDGAAHPLVDERIGEYLTRADLHQKAGEAFGRAARQARSSKRAAALWYRAALSRRASDQPSAQVEALCEAVLADPTHGEALDALVEAATGLGTDGERIAGVLEKVLRHVKDRGQKAALHVSVAQLHMDQGNSTSAKQHLRASLALNGTDTDTLQMLAEVCEASGDLRAGADALEKLIAQCVDLEQKFQTYLKLGEIYARVPDKNRARGVLIKASTIRADDPAVKSQLDALD